MPLENLDSLFLGACDVLLFPAGWPTAVFVFDEEMSCTNLALTGRAVHPSRGCAVMLGHVDLELLGVGVLRRLPSRLVGLGVEVVWQVLRIRMSYLPVGRETCVGLVVVSISLNTSLVATHHDFC